MRRAERDVVPVAWKSDIERSVLEEGARERGWARADGRWDFYWLSVNSVKAFFALEGAGLGVRQAVNHFPNHSELTRKDLMVRNLRRHLRECPAESVLTARGERLELGGDFLPQSFVLPAELPQFQEEFARRPGARWILKPASRAQGSGISLLTRAQQARALPATLAHMRSAPGCATENFVVCRYIEEPLLIGGRKFDLRLYVLVTSFRPLTVWRYREGFARFCLEEYAARPGSDPNTALFAHLTNVAFQKQNENYDERHGGKWPFSSLLTFIEAQRGHAAVAQLQREIDALFVKSLRAVQAVIVDCPQAFELYGFDVLVDRQLKPWLVEVNASPSLLTTTRADKRLKRRLVGDLMAVVALRWGAEPPGSPPLEVGLFELLYAQRREEPRRARSVARKEPSRPAFARY